MEFDETFTTATLFDGISDGSFLDVQDNSGKIQVRTRIGEDPDDKSWKSSIFS